MNTIMTMCDVPGSLFASLCKQMFRFPEAGDGCGGGGGGGGPAGAEVCGFGNYQLHTDS